MPLVPTLPRGNASRDALRHSVNIGRRASLAAFPRRAWERSIQNCRKKNPRTSRGFFMCDQSARERINLRDSDAVSAAYRQRECPSVWSADAPDHLPATRPG
ncbi:DUF1534 domain-containing protein [Pseudomonas sp. H3(2019)]|nr:DUF1534 domain-containing protein [Pseudomonas sp. H3(2019)]